MPEPLTPPVEPFSATVSAFGNSMLWSGGAFEPLVFRNRFTALENSPDRVVIAPELLSKYDSLREGFYDEAEVRIYRIEQGRFRLARRDTVAANGSYMSGWIRVLRESQAVAPGTTTYTYRWDDWNRPDTPYHFTVRAVDLQGRLSAPAAAVAVHRMKGVSRPTPANALVNLPVATGVATLPAPNNLRFRFNDGGTVQLEWDPVTHRDLAGYAIFRSDYPPEQHKGYFLQLKQIDRNNPVRAGDMIIVSKKYYGAPRATVISNRVWSAEGEFRQFLPGLLQSFPGDSPGKTWKLAKHDPGTSVSDGGETYLQLQLEGGARETLALYNHAGTKQTYYEVLEQRPYRVEVWLRQTGQGSVRFALSGFYGSGPQVIQPIEFTPGPEWKKYTTTFTPGVLHTGEQPGQMLLEFTGPGTFSIDNFRVYRADADYLDFLPEEAQALKVSAMQALRTHGTIKTGLRSYDLNQLTNPAGITDGIRKGNTLPQMLAAFAKIGVRPWLQIEYHLAPDEWLGLIEYLAAPYTPGQDAQKSKPWAHKRHTQGHHKPWADEFDRIYIELGNETWNRLFRPWTFEPMQDALNGKNYSAGQVYGLYQEHVISILKSSPYWKSAGLDKKIIFILGGQASNSRYGHDAAALSPSSSLLTIGSYIGGWDESEGPPPMTGKSLFYVLNQISQSGGPVTELLVKAGRESEIVRQRPVALGTYEAGPGYAMNGLNGAKVTADQALEQERVMKSLAAGTATLDSFLLKAKMGLSLQNFFTFGSGLRWTSHTPWHEGRKSHPAWEFLSLFNREATGEMLRVVTISIPTANIEAIGRRKHVTNAPLVAVYATRSKSRYAIFIISRKVPGYPQPELTGFTPVSLELPFKRAQTVTLFRIPGFPGASHIAGDDIKIETISIGAVTINTQFTLNQANGASALGLPPGTAYLYVFEGTSNTSETKLISH